MQKPIVHTDFIFLLEALTLVVLTINFEIHADERALSRTLRLLPLLTLLLAVSILGALGSLVTPQLAFLPWVAFGLKLIAAVALPMAAQALRRFKTPDGGRMGANQAMAWGLALYGFLGGAAALTIVAALHGHLPLLSVFIAELVAFVTLLVPTIASMRIAAAQFHPHLGDPLARRLFRGLQLHAVFFTLLLASGWLFVNHLSSPSNGIDSIESLRRSPEGVQILTRMANGLLIPHSNPEYFARRLFGIGFTAAVFLIFMSMYYRYRSGFLNSLRLSSSQLRSLTAEQRYFAAIENIPGLFLLFTPRDGTILMTNQHFAVLLRKPIEQLTSRSLSAVCEGPHLFLADTLLSAARSLSGGTVVETEGSDPDGRRINLRWTLAPVQGAKGVEIIALATDITELRSTEKSLQRAKETAERANEAKGHFLANMSHEIRTPINGILGMTGILLDSHLTREQRHCAEVASASARSLLQIVNDILDYSKIEAGRIDLDTVDFDILGALEFVTELLANDAAQKGLSLSFVIDEDVPRFLRGDPGRLRQVLLNLCGNAIKFTPAGEVFVRVHLLGRCSSCTTLRFEIGDTGIGIAEHEQHKLFQVFSQVHGNGRETLGGTGLGLAISAKLVQMMGGQIGVQSAPDQGSVFWFTASFTIGSVESSPRRPLERCNAAVLDRSEHVRHMIAMQLRLLGAQVSHASSLKELTSKGDNAPFHVALIEQAAPAWEEEDVQMPAGLQGARIVLLVRHNEHPDPRLVRLAGFAGTLTKPSNLASFEEAVSGALGLPPPERPARSLRTLSEKSLAEAGFPQLRVLVAEDNHVNQELTLYHLNKLGCCAEVVADGIAALEAAQRETFDVILMDIQMPGMDGVAATRHIRKLEKGRGRHTPIIAMTAHAMKGDRERYLSEGMDDYVAKPVEFSDLVGAMERQLGIRLQSQDSSPPRETRTNTLETNSIVFDRKGALTRFAGDEQILRRIVGVFLLEAPSCLNRLGNALQQGALREADEWAHSLKGACGAVGAHAMLTAVLELRTALQNSTPDEIAYQFQTLSLEFQRTQAALELEFSPCEG